MTEIRIYVEGGGDRDSKARLRRGLDQFLGAVRQQAILRATGWQVIPSGSREDAFLNFRLAQRQHPRAFNVLLVDAEGPVSGSVRAHLEAADGWRLEGWSDEQLHLMVQVMESWFVADPGALRAYYGQGFAEGALPRNPDVERGLKRATERTSKGEYHKTRHAPDLLSRIDPRKVRGAARHCDRLFAVLLAKTG